MATLNKRNAVSRMLAGLDRLDRLCAQYQTFTGNVRNDTLFSWMHGVDNTYATAKAAYDELAGVLTNVQIGDLLDEFIVPPGTNVQSTLVAIRNATWALQDAFAAQLVSEIDGRERTRVNREWVWITSIATARAPIDAAVADLRTALEPLVI